MQAFISETTVGSVDFSSDLYMKIYFSGCDFKCLFCNTPELLETKFEHETDLKEVKKEMKNQRGTVEGILITGGEPCFQKQALLELLNKAKELKMKTAIDTNGSKPAVIETLLKNKLIDTIMMDLKAPFNELFDKVTRSTTFFKSSKDIMTDFKETLQVLKAYDETTNITFQTTIVPSLIFRKEDLLKIAEEIKGMKAVWELKPFNKTGVKDKRMQEMTRPTTAFLENIRDYINKELPMINIIVKS